MEHRERGAVNGSDERRLSRRQLLAIALEAVIILVAVIVVVVVTS